MNVIPREINAIEANPSTMPAYVQMSYICLKTRVSRASVKAKLRIVTMTNASVAPRTERGVPVRKRPRNSKISAVKMAGVKRYLNMNVMSRKRCGVMAPSFSVPILKRTLPAAPSKATAIITPQTTYLSNVASR